MKRKKKAKRRPSELSKRLKQNQGRKPKSRGSCIIVFVDEFGSVSRTNSTFSDDISRFRQKKPQALPDSPPIPLPPTPQPKPPTAPDVPPTYQPIPHVVTVAEPAGFIDLTSLVRTTSAGNQQCF